MLTAILAILKFLPDFIDLAKRVAAAIENGVEIILIKKAMKDLDLAFQVEDPKERAKRINDEFRK